MQKHRSISAEFSVGRLWQVRQVPEGGNALPDSQRLNRSMLGGGQRCGRGWVFSSKVLFRYAGVTCMVCSGNQKPVKKQ